MDIWMDMTNSLQTWKSGVVGIIRAELELARNLKKIYPNIRFSICKENGFVEVSSESLNWLWNSDSVTDAYLIAMDRVNNNNKSKADKQQTMTVPLSNAYKFSDSRRERLREAGRVFIANKSPILKPICNLGFNIVFKPIEFASVVRTNSKRYKRTKELTKAHNFKQVDTNKEYKYPYNDNDVIFSCGWYTSNKEYMFSKVKSQTRNISLVYLVYDIIPVKLGTEQFYDSDTFRKYLNWIANNCDSIIYGGKTAKRDAEKYFIQNDLPIPNGIPIKFGTEIFKSVNKISDDEVITRLGVQRDFLITVGSIEPRKNYDTLYKAYTILLDKYNRKDIPQLVIVGGAYQGSNILDCIKIDPRIKDKIIMLRPTDEELDILYRKCKFALLPSLYEGWSLTLPEALSYGKLCICSDVDPLREIADEITYFVDAENPFEWARTIKDFSDNCDNVKKYEDIIKTSWKNTTWRDSADMVLQILLDIINRKTNGTSKDIYYDLTLTWHSCFTNAYVSGILRTQLILARLLSKKIPQMKFIAITPNGFINIDKNSLNELLSNGDIDEAFKKSKKSIIECEPSKTDEKLTKVKTIINQNSDAFWLFCSVLPEKIQSRVVRLGRQVKKDSLQRSSNNEIPKIGYDLGTPSFKKDDIILTTGTGYNLECYPTLKYWKEKIGFKFIQLVYDYTPILIPQTHLKQTCEFYTLFLENTALLSDSILYGGATALRDGEKYCRDNNLPIKPGYPIKFGSNIVNNKDKKIDDSKVLENLGISGSYTLTVGSIEMRKNHETLYKAYLYMLDESNDTVPQMVFAGYPGWKTQEFLEILRKDKRVKDKIIIVTPTDEEMEVLYRNCLFTILASMYEGWSLTLPESLNYGKFCIASDVDPLKEIGLDFIDYVHPFDTKKWAEKILYYAQNLDELKKREAKIASEWHSISWDECAEQVVGILENIS